MKLTDYIITEGFLHQLACDNIADAVVCLVDCLAAGGHVGSPAELVEEVMRRETEGSTAIGGGLVIPHARFGDVRQVRIAVATLKDPVSIPAEDDRPVDIVILLVGPDGDPRQMLRVLARLARLVRRESFLDGLRQATSPETLQTAFAKVGESIY
jgi:mannitol/fructose-specific phosphotransferase system IIA component (Ntr-type)